MSEVLWEQTVWLTCSECGGNFEVSSIVSEAMLMWQDESGDPIVCAFCSGVYEIYKPGDGAVEEANDMISQMQEVHEHLEEANKKQ